MADLIIKPLTGAGNTVKIQDQAGGSILTSADSGATIDGGVTIPAAGVTGVLPVGVTGGSGLDAISIGAADIASGVLPVGVTGGSGLDAIAAAGVTGTLPNAVTDNITTLGTVASGNFSNSAIVYPAGHQLQMVQSSNDLAQVTNITTTANTQSNSHPYVDITPKAANSKYHMFGKLYISCDPGYSQPQLQFAVSTDGGSSYTHKPGSDNWSYGSWFCWNQLNGEWTVFFEDWYQSSFSADQANIRFAISYRNVYHSTSQYAFNAGSGEDNNGHIIIYEVAT